MKTEQNTDSLPFLWDAQVCQDGKWVSIFGPFDCMDDAEDVIDEAAKRETQSRSFRILPIPLSSFRINTQR